MVYPTEVADGVFVSDIVLAEQHADDFEHVLSLTLTDPDFDTEYARKPLVDGHNAQEIFDSAVTLAIHMIEADGSVLIHCNAGRSRSPVVVITALASLRDEKFETVRQDVWKSYKKLSIHPVLHNHAMKFLDEEKVYT